MRGGQHVACQFRDIKKAHLKKSTPKERRAFDYLVSGFWLFVRGIPGNFFDEKF